MSLKVSKNNLEVAEKIGSFIEYWGFKEVHGRIWTLIFLSPEPVDANFLIENLEISKALASMSIKELLYYNVILEVKKDKPGTQKYSINPDITQVILDVIQKRELVMLTEIQASYKSLTQSHASKPDRHIDNDRLVELGVMVDAAYILLQGMTAGSMVDFNIFSQATNLKKD